jgi:hypothetical protein
MTLPAVYEYLCHETRNPELFVTHLKQSAQPWDTARSSVLFLPMYSMGLPARTITPRIRWLRENGKDTNFFADATERDIRKIVDADISRNQRFGLENRLFELRQRAQQVTALRDAEDFLSPIGDWSDRDLLDRLNFLTSLKGMSYLAALHVLMELQWSVVKPDLHIRRVLSQRIGGRWRRYFFNGDRFDLYVIPFLHEWRAACSEWRDLNPPPPPPRESVNFPALSTFRSRQIDWLFMCFAQNGTADEAWRPTPICGTEPQCEVCPVDKCESRPSESLCSALP